MLISQPIAAHSILLDREYIMIVEKEADLGQDVSPDTHVNGYE